MQQFLLLFWVAAIADLSFALEALNADDSIDDDDSCEISQIHLAVGKEPATQMTVSFAVPYSCPVHSTVPVTAVVTYWEEGDDSNTAQAKYAKDEDIKQYNHTSCVYEDLKYVSPYFHHIRLDDLKPNTKYVYQCTLIETAEETNFVKNELPGKQINATSTSRLLGILVGNILVESEELIFNTASVPGDGAKPLKFALIADYGQTEISLSTRDILLGDDDIGMILIAGDLAYANTMNGLWDEWFDLNEPVFSKVPTMPAPGNHEIETDNSTYQIFVPYENRFGMFGN